MGTRGARGGHLGPAQESHMVLPPPRISSPNRAMVLRESRVTIVGSVINWAMCSREKEDRCYVESSLCRLRNVFKCIYSCRKRCGTWMTPVQGLGQAPGTGLSAHQHPQAPFQVVLEIHLAPGHSCDLPVRPRTAGKVPEQFASSYRRGPNDDQLRVNPMTTLSRLAYVYKRSAAPPHSTPG